MSTPASDQQCQIGINVEYVTDSSLPPLELSSLSGFGTDVAYLSPDQWRAPHSASSDSGSECHSVASSPFSSPLLGASDLLTGSAGFLEAGLDGISHLSIQTDLQPGSYSYHSPSALPSPSLPFPDSPASSPYSGNGDFFFNYPSPTQYSSSQSSLVGSLHSPSPSPIKLGQAPLALGLYSSPDISPSLYPSSASPVNEGLFLSPGPHDPCYPMSSLSSSPFRSLPSSVHPPKSSPTFLPEVTEFITEVAESQPQLDAESVRHQLLKSLSSSGEPDTDDLKTLFSKGAKSTVSTEAGRQASKSRRKHPARFACHFPGCNSTFTRKLGLENHHKSHLGITDQQCRFCLKRFPNSLPRHMKRCKDNPNRITTKKTKRPEFSAESGTMR